jgi:hypothetical protein
MSNDVERAIGVALGPLAGKVGASALHSAAGGVMRAAGSLPVGDPPAMRAAAHRLHDIARRTRSEADHRMAAFHRCASWSGGLHDHTAAQIDGDVRFIRDHAARLDHVADELMMAAGRVEQAQHAWRVRLDRLSADAAYRLRSLVR